MFAWTRIVEILKVVVLVAFSAIIHECAHGWAAYKLGDPTAKEQGRLTLNPLAHLDLTGSIIIPLLMAIVGGPIFAFAKPVPFDPRRLNNPERDEALVALAGPVSNILQALIGDIILFIVVNGGNILLDMGFEIYGPAQIIATLAMTYMYVNLTLAFFNLIPIPPLDGSKLISPLLHGDSRRIYNYLQLYGMPILILLVYVIPRIVGIDLVGAYLDFTVDNTFELLTFWWT